MRLVSVNTDRLWNSLMTMARVGATGAGGVTRLALSDEDREARDLFCRWLRDAGLDVAIDDLGNIFGWRTGTERALSPVLLGSHLDSVPQGGKFDGALGTLAALEVVRSLNDAGIRTRRSLVVVAFTAEEGARFEPSCLGSSVMTGRFSLEYVYTRPARERRVTFREELQRVGYMGSAASRPPVPRAFLELHIEQGPVLDRDQVQIGVVEGIVGIVWLEARLVGQAGHAGTTPMDARRDALVGAGRVIHSIRDLTRRWGGAALSTVGRLRVEPDVINTVPGRTTLGIDLRHADTEELRRLEQAVRQEVERVAREEGLEANIEPVQALPATKFDPALVELVEEAAHRHGLSSRRMVSGAGHDSQWMARLCPTTMIFVPCRSGRSHCEDEEISPAQAADGAKVLGTVALHLAQA
jgi:N-carbamoyl-L-amino-acid hydrolase